MTKVRDFKVGDKVYSLHWGDGVVTNINPGAIYPVEVKWSDGNYDCFTAQGQCDCEMADSDIDIVPIEEVKKESKFHVGDSVYSPKFGEGTVTFIDDSPTNPYPVEVEWNDEEQGYEYFTPDGKFTVADIVPEFNIVPADYVKEAHEYEDEAKKEPEFKVGDHVVSRHYGRGVVVRIVDPTKADYPVGVHWLNESSNSIYAYEYYTLDGQLHTQFPDPEYDIIKEEDENPEFKIMDRVFYPFYGKGTVVEAWKTDEPYPIRVVWDKPPYKNEPWSSFTRDGIMSISRFVGSDEVKLILVKDIPKEETGGSEVGQIAGVITHNIAKKMEEDNEKMSVDDRKFKVGERVWSPYFGSGTVTSTEAESGAVFPIKVHWDDGHPFGDDVFFTEDGKYTIEEYKPEMDIYHIEPKDAEKVLPSILHELGEADEEEDNKKVEDAINPAHYKVEGLPEAIDIMNHLMTPEQFEGFLWGNIMKYAYRFGRKGDKGETAGKISWYANQLKAVEDWRKENET